MKSKVTTDTFIFDLDNTLYSPDIGLLSTVSGRISEFIVSRLGMPRPEADALRTAYRDRFGITLTGLLKLHDVDPDDFDTFVYDIDYIAKVQADAALDSLLAGIPQRKIVYTNAGMRHAETVLKLLGIRKHIDMVVAIENLDFHAKPTEESFRRFISMTGITPESSLFFEDFAPNLDAALPLGFQTVLVGGEPDPKFHHHLQSIYELATLLRKLYP